MKGITICILLATYSMVNAQINNLVHPADYQTGKLGELGEVKEFGSGDETMILLAGWGFDWTIFQGFIDQYQDRYKLYAVTIPGFGQTQAPPMPEDSANFQDLVWTKGVIKGLSKLMDDKEIDSTILVSYFTYSEVVAIRMALDFPDRISKVMVISGVAKYTNQYVSYEPRNLNQRTYYIEKALAPNWFRTVDKATWDNGNFHLMTFSQDSAESKKYWEQMSAVPIPTMVRYLCEYYCTDISLEYENLKVPVLAVVPSFSDELIYNKDTGYLHNFFHDSWWGARPANSLISVVTLTETNAFITEDQPEKLYNLIDEFLSNQVDRYRVLR